MGDAKGFTLVEMLLSVGIIAMLAGLSLPLLASYQNRNDLDLTTQSLIQALRRAQTYAQSGKDDSQWGIEIQSTAITLFKGAVFASRDTAYDETQAISPGTNVSGLTEVLFAKFTGAITTTPIAGDTITLTNVNNDTRTVTINAKGMVSY